MENDNWVIRKCRFADIAKEIGEMAVYKLRARTVCNALLHARQFLSFPFTPLYISSPPCCLSPLLYPRYQWASLLAWPDPESPPLEQSRAWSVFRRYSLGSLTEKGPREKCVGRMVRRNLQRGPAKVLPERGPGKCRIPCAYSRPSAIQRKLVWDAGRSLIRKHMVGNVTRDPISPRAPRLFNKTLALSLRSDHTDTPRIRKIEKPVTKRKKKIELNI